LKIHKAINHEDIPHHSLNGESSVRAQRWITVHPHAAIPSGKSQPSGVVLDAIRRPDFEKEPVWFKNAVAEIVKYAILAVLTEARKLPCERQKRVDQASRSRGRGPTHRYTDPRLQFDPGKPYFELTKHVDIG